MDINRMDIQEFRDKGFLQEVNRQFFHPLGIALEILIDGDKIQLGGIWDYREDPEGMMFDGTTIDQDKIDRIETLRESKREKRIKLFGDTIQPPRDE